MVFSYLVMAVGLVYGEVTLLAVQLWSRNACSWPSGDRERMVIF